MMIKQRWSVATKAAKYSLFGISMKLNYSNNIVKKN